MEYHINQFLEIKRGNRLLLYFASLLISFFNFDLDLELDPVSGERHLGVELAPEDVVLVFGDMDGATSTSDDGEETGGISPSIVASVAVEGMISLGSGRAPSLFTRPAFLRCG